MAAKISRPEEEGFVRKMTWNPDGIDLPFSLDNDTH